MTQENKRQIKDLLEDVTILLETLVADVIHSTNKIYACYPPGEISSSLFDFKDDSFIDDFVYNFDVIKDVLEKNIALLPYEKTDEILILGNLLLEIKEYELAIEIFDNLLKFSPENSFAWANLMSVYIYNKMNKKAMECYIHLPPDFLEHSANEKKDPKADSYRVLNITTAYPLHTSLSSMGSRTDRSKELKQQYEQELRGLYSIKEFVKGQEALEEENFDEAFILLSGLSSKHPESHLLYFFTGKAALEGKHYLIAEENFKKAIQIQNDIPEYWHELAESFFSQHKNEQAIKSLKTALTLDSSSQGCWSLAGRMINTIKTQNEYEYFVKQIQLMPSVEAILKFIPVREAASRRLLATLLPSPI